LTFPFCKNFRIGSAKHFFKFALTVPATFVEVKGEFLYCFLFEVEFGPHRFLLIVFVEQKLFNFIAQQLELTNYGVERSYYAQIYALVESHEPIADVFHVGVP